VPGLPQELARDARFRMRSLRKSPGFAVMAAGSLALGIGAATAMYSVIYAVLLDPFPYKDVAHLASPALREPGRRGSTWRSSGTARSSMA
jgi:hypothetical protein